MEGDTKKTQGLDTNIPPSAPNAPSTSATNSVNFSSNDIGRTTVAHQKHEYFTNVKKGRRSPKQFFTKKHIIIITIATLLLIGVIASVFFFLTQSTVDSNNKTDVNTTDANTQEKTTEEEITNRITEYAKEADSVMNQEDTISEDPADDDQPSRISQIRSELQDISTSSNTTENNRIEALNLLTSTYTRESQYSDAISIIEQSLIDNEYSDDGEFSLLTNLVSYYDAIRDATGYKSALQRIVDNINRSKIQDNDITNYYKAELEKLNNAQ